MNIKKSLIALAVVSSITPFAAQAADVTISGVVQTKIAKKDTDANTAGAGIAEVDDLIIAAGDVRLNIAAEDTRGGITGYANYRLDADALSNESSASAVSINDTEVNFDDAGIVQDSVYVGFKGGFGDIRLGEVAVMADYGQVANDLHDIAGDYEKHLSYTNAFGGLKFGLAFGFEDDNLTGNDDDFVGLGLQYSGGGLTVGAGYDNAKEDRYSVGAKYDFGPAYIAAHFGDDGDELDIFAVKAGVSAGTWSFDGTYSVKEDHSDEYQLNANTSLTDALNLNVRFSGLTADDALVNNGTLSDQTEFRVLLGYSF